MNEPLVIFGQGRDVRVRHDYPNMSMYSGCGQKVHSTILLLSDVEGMRLAPTMALGDRCPEGRRRRTVGLWRR